MKQALISWLGLLLLFASAGAVLCVDLGRELVAGSWRRHRWIDVVAYGVVPVLLVLAVVATGVRIFTLA